MSLKHMLLCHRPERFGATGDSVRCVRVRNFARGSLGQRHLQHGGHHLLPLLAAFQPETSESLGCPRKGWLTLSIVSISPATEPGYMQAAFYRAPRRFMRTQDQCSRAILQQTTWPTWERRKLTASFDLQVGHRVQTASISPLAHRHRNMAHSEILQFSPGSR